MNFTRKSALFILMAVISFSLLTIPAFADNQGLTKDDPVVMTSGTTCTKLWEYPGRKSCYNKITLTSAGCVTFAIEKGMNSRGYQIDYTIDVYTENDENIFSGDTEELESGGTTYNFTIPLDKGTYYILLAHDQYMYDSSYNFSTRYKYTFSANNSWEKEPNNTISTANVISLGKMYSAIFNTAESADFFAVDLEKGKNYILRLENYKGLDYEYVEFSVVDSVGNSLKLTDEDYYDYSYEGVRDLGFKTSVGGRHYVRFDCRYSYKDSVNYKFGVYFKRLDASAYTVKLSKTAYAYTGKAITPSVKVTDGAGKALVKDVDYKVTYPSGRTNVGTYKVKIDYIGGYKGSKTVSFKINPPTPAFSSVSAGEASFTAKWKQTKQTTGYELQYATSSNFKSAKTVKLTSYKTVSKKISSLKEAKKYYVRIRTYKTVNKTNYYSSWSAVKNVTTKKIIQIKMKSSKANVYVGGTVTPSYTVYPAKAKVKWNSGNTAVAKVNSKGVITGVKAGTATITASFKYNNKTYKATVKVTVKNPSVTLNKTSALVYKWSTLKLKATVRPSSAKVLWKTSNAYVATVNSSGVITGVAPGTAYITAYFTYGGKTYSQSCTVTVKIQPSVTFVDVYWKIDSANGVKPRMKIRNNTNKVIKYMEFDTTFRNRFADPAYCEIWNRCSRVLWIEGGLDPKEETTFYWDPVLYNRTVSRIDIGQVRITYIDNTKETINLNRYWYDDNYYYQ